MRIGGGALRGRSLRVAEGVRPTSGRTRGALFDIWGSRLPGSRFLDLFAGSGAVGIEALSRGAVFCAAIESSARTFRVLRANFENLCPAGRWHLARQEVLQGLDGVSSHGPFDLIFADPPYGFDCWVELLGGLAPLLAGGAEIALEHDRQHSPPSEDPVFELLSRRAYGESTLSFYRASSSCPR